MAGVFPHHPRPADVCRCLVPEVPAGGIKVSRILILLKTVKKELIQLLHPRSVRRIQIDGKAIEHEVVRSTNVYMGVYIFIFAFSMLLIALNNFDLITNFSAVAATLNNIGPGLSLVGPIGNFSMFSDFSKLVLIFDMLAGRLELFPLLLLFVPNNLETILNRFQAK